MLPVVAERVGFEPTYRLLTDNPISSRARYDRTSLPLREVVNNFLFLTTLLEKTA